MKKHSTSLLGLLTGLWLTTGCAVVVPVPSGKPYGNALQRSDTRFIVAGKTTRAELVERLGPACRESPRIPALAYAWEPSGINFYGIYGFLYYAETFETGYNTWRAFFVRFDDEGRVSRTAFKRLSQRKSLDEHLEKWAMRGQ